MFALAFSGLSGCCCGGGLRNLMMRGRMIAGCGIWGFARIEGLGKGGERLV